MGEDSAQDECFVISASENIPQKYMSIFWNGYEEGHKDYCLRNWYQPKLDVLKNDEERHAYVKGYVCAVTINMRYERDEIYLLECQWNELFPSKNISNTRRLYDSRIEKEHRNKIEPCFRQFFDIGFNESYSDTKRESFFHPDHKDEYIPKITDAFLKGVQTGYDIQDRYSDLFADIFNRPIKKKGSEF